MMTQSRNGLLDNTDDLIWNLTPPELFKEKEEKIEIKKQYQQQQHMERDLYNPKVSGGPLEIIRVILPQHGLRRWLIPEW